MKCGQYYQKLESKHNYDDLVILSNGNQKIRQMEKFIFYKHLR